MTIAFLDGTVTDAGIGFACQAVHQIATNNTVVCFRQTEYGLFPAANLIYAIKDLKGRGPAIGLYLCLTGATLSGLEAVKYGIASHLVMNEKQGDILYTFDNLVFGTTDDSMFRTILNHFAEKICPDPLFEK